MKNLFKNLMLVAVAAMAFTACEEASEPVVKNEKHTITFTADFESETRSAFGALDGTSYPSYWEGNEKAKFNQWTESNGNKEEKVVAISNGNRFSVDFDYNVDYGTNIDAYVPAESWGEVKNKWVIDYDTYDSYCEAYREYTIPAEQTPTATSVDPKAHILKAEIVYRGEDNVQITFKHQVAYGKFSIKNLALESGDAVASVILDINGKKYTVNTDATADIWFACEPATVENMTVTFNTTNGKGYEKVLVKDSDKTLAFVKGQVAEFGVDMEGVSSGAAADTFNPDVTLNSPVKDSNNGVCFKFVIAEGGFIRIWLAEEKRMNDTMAVGSYTGNGDGTNDNYQPSANQFAATIYDKWGDRVSGCRARNFTSASTLEVSYDNDVYTVVLVHNGKTYGYKGLPDGWVAPGGGTTPEPEPEQPGEGGGEQPGEGGATTPDQTVAITTLSTSNGRNLTFNDGKLSMTLIWPNAYSPNGSYKLVAGESSENSTAHTIMVDGVAATTVSGTVSVEWQSYGQYLFIVTFNNVVIDGVAYTGTASTPY